MIDPLFAGSYFLREKKAAKAARASSDFSSC
jgi:hypothetical protein